MKLLLKGYKFIFKVLEWIAMFCMVVMVVIVFIEVIRRYIFGAGYKWSQEISTLAMVWFGFIGIAIGVLERIHISIGLFTMKLSKKWTDLLDKINFVLIAIFGGFMIYYGIVIMDMTKKTTLPATKWPSSVLYFILPLSGLLVLLSGIIVATGHDDKVREMINNTSGKGEVQ